MKTAKFRSYSTNSPLAGKSGRIYDLEVIRQDILNMVNTRKGEYPLDLNRGFLIHDFLFSPSLNELEKNMIVTDARNQLEEDPRFEIRDIQVFNDSEDQHIILYLSLFVPPLNESLNLTIDIEER